MDLIPKGTSLTGSGTAPVSVIVMTFNEEANIAFCLQMITGWASEVFVVDSFSTDKTEEIAGQFPVRFVQHAYESAPAQWDWAIKTLPFTNEWIFAVDADFRVTPELRAALANELPSMPP